MNEKHVHKLLLKGTDATDAPRNERYGNEGFAGGNLATQNINRLEAEKASKM